MKTIALTIFIDEDLQEFLIAELADLDFEGFEQDDDRLKAFIPAARWNDVVREQIERWLVSHGVTTPMREEEVAPQNWNRLWEETIQPIVVGRFLVRPTWAPAPADGGDLILLEIDPKMSFGTGYHESTRLVLRMLPGVVRPGDRVLDAGTGTGILAIAALKLGADSAVAFDTDEWAQENAVENFYLNDVAERVAFREGSMDVVLERDFDLILANINLNVLLDMMPTFAEKTRAGGRLVMAGLLRQDRDRVCDAAGRNGFTLLREGTENDWWSGAWERA